MRTIPLASILAINLFAAETPFDLIRPVYPMKWSTSTVTEGGTVYDFANFNVNEKDTEANSPKSGEKPEEFMANAYISDTLNQAYIDAMNLQASNLRVNQAGYLPDDPEKQFYYVSNSCESATYSVVDLDGKEVATNGKFTANGDSAQSARTVKAYVTAVDPRYTVEKSTPKTKVCVGKLADMASLPTDKRLRIKVGKEYSSTFIVSDKVYSMVRDANLKFFGVQRSGDSESWFHEPSHVHDTIPGGWYDCGDYLKMAPTMGYAFLMLSLLSATNPERDEDHYAFNHNEIVNTDGIPDMLREARHGAEFYLRSYEYAKGEIKDMIVNIGDETDHLYWNRADNMESMNPVPARPVIHGIGPGMSAQVAAGLALLSTRYTAYDKVFADSCLNVAIKLYDYAKEHFGEPEVCVNNLYACASSLKSVDVLAMAAIALHYATYEKTKKMDYLSDAAEDKKINNNINAQYSFEYFPAGWLGNKNGFTPGGWPSDYENRFSITLYAFYKLLLADKATAEKYGIQDSERLDYTKRVLYSLAQGAEFSIINGTKTIDMLGKHQMKYSTPWYVTFSFSWGSNYYESGNIINMLTYAEVAKDVEAKKTLGDSIAWNHAKVRQLAINKMNYILGVNQWDICFMTGVGDKNESHVHHRTANPEFWNGGEKATYSYRPPVGALMGGSMNDTLLSDVEHYTATETAISGNASFLATNVLLAAATQIDTSSTVAIQKKAVKASHALKVATHGKIIDIHYGLTKAGNVNISLVSVSGKQVKQHHSDNQAAGNHTLQWNTEQMPTGAYIVKFRAGTIREFKVIKIEH